MCELSQHTCRPQRADYQRAVDQVPEMIRVLNADIDGLVEEDRRLRKEIERLQALLVCSSCATDKPDGPGIALICRKCSAEAAERKGEG